MWTKQKSAGGKPSCIGSRERLRFSLRQVSNKSEASQGQAEDKSEILNPQPLTPSTQAEAEAEGYFLKASDIARKQQTKSLELWAVMSLVRLRQHQAQDHAIRNTQHETRTKLDAARTMLADVYNWFTEGVDTKDLQEAKVLLAEFADPSLLLSLREKGTEDI